MFRPRWLQLDTHSRVRPHEGSSRVKFVCRQRARLDTLDSSSSVCGGSGSGTAALAAVAGGSEAAGVLQVLLPASSQAVTVWSLEDVGDQLVGSSSLFARQSRRAVHQVERLEHRLQKHAAALPVGLRRLLAGGVAGAASKTATAPLETLRMQMVQTDATTLVAAAAATWQRGGVAAFFRGNSVDVLRTIPSRSLELSSYEWLKKALRRWNRKHNGELHIPDHLVTSIAGGLAGAFSSTLVYPLETARTRMALGSSHDNFVSTLAGVVREEGGRALFKGLDASLVGVVPYTAFRLASYDAMKSLWRRSTGRKDIDPQAALLFGAVAGVVSAVATYPLEVTRRRMMAGAAYPNVAAALATIVREEGASALFNGVLLSLLRQGPAMAITFATFEMAKQFLEL